MQQQIDQIVGATGGVDQNLRLRNVGSNLPHYVDAVDFRKLIGRDNYVRVDGQWLFEHRHGLPIWCYDQNQDPVTGFERLPGGMPIRLPADYPAFRQFWTDFTDEQVAEVTRTPV